MPTTTDPRFRQPWHGVPRRLMRDRKILQRVKKVEPQDRGRLGLPEAEAA